MGLFQNIMINVILDTVDNGRSWEILSGQGEDSIGKNTNFRWKGDVEMYRGKQDYAFRFFVEQQHLGFSAKSKKNIKRNGVSDTEYRR